MDQAGQKEALLAKADAFDEPGPDDESEIVQKRPGA